MNLPGIAILSIGVPIAAYLSLKEGLNIISRGSFEDSLQTPITFALNGFL